MKENNQLIETNKTGKYSDIVPFIQDKYYTGFKRPIHILYRQFVKSPNINEYYGLDLKELKSKLEEL
jgi:hypothetical protein